MNDAHQQPHTPNVILVTFDSLSAKDMSLYGYRRNTTPFIDSFAGESYVFENMHANSNSSIPSLASILTGRYPMKHSYDMLRSSLTPGGRAEDLADVLKSKGYRTAAVLGSGAGYLWINSLGQVSHGCMSKMMAGRSKDRSVSKITRSLDATLRKTLEVLDSACEPFFLWLHIYPPHRPYLPSRAFRGTFVKKRVFDVIGSQRPYRNRFYPEAAQDAVDRLRARYNEHILEVDHKFGSFLEAVRKRGLFDTSMIIVTSDHGEMFEKGYQGHGGPLLYNPLLHIPLIWRLPSGQPGRRVKTNAEQVDIAPTVLDLLGLEIPRHLHGESLVGAMLGEYGSAKPKFSVSRVCRRANGDSLGRSMSVVFNGHKLILDLPSGACELYDLVRDPGEDTDLAASEPYMGRELKGMILERFANNDNCLRVCHDRC
jgi:arylsulfatase A-like enzyme